MTIKSPTSQVFALALRIFKNHQITGMIPAINTSLVLTPPLPSAKTIMFYLFVFSPCFVGSRKRLRSAYVEKHLGNSCVVLRLAATNGVKKGKIHTK